MRLVECVPNFSEGRSDEVLAALTARIESVAGVRVLDASRDVDHNRSVVTFAGPPDSVAEAAFRGIEEAQGRIDLRTHEGVHPRIGATDVCPFVPLAGASVEDCIEVAHALARRVGEELAIPIFLYGSAARKPEHRELPDVRRGGLTALGERMSARPEQAPDEGPATLHPTSGATAIGVRPYLVAFNVNLESDDVDLARSIAARIREAGGGLPGVRALGLPLARGGGVQVSLNLCDFQRTGLLEVFEAVAVAAERVGVAVRESELIGLAPTAALDEEIARRVRLKDFDPRAMIVEERVQALAFDASGDLSA